ncbi:DUF2207 domain-containing protein [Candidatus Parcubacteria bacterium]|nr:DUF2207 domain-containing protein [Candidatus Parcubacteria bacterium]
MLKRKKIFFQISLIVLSSICLALPVAAQEKINNFETEININQDGSINVKEMIVYDFGSEEKHGIFRDIPYKYKVGGESFKLHFSDFSVTDRNGNDIIFDVDNYKESKRIKIGDPDVYVGGVRHYVIKYRVKRAINFFDDHDELYWNVTGQTWVTPVRQTKATINLPKSVNIEKLKFECYTGKSGSNEKCVSSRLNFIAKDEADSIIFSDDSLRPGEGVTIVVGFPKGIVKKFSWLKIFLETAKDNWIVILPLFSLLFFIYFWRKYGKDPAGRKTIIAEFAAPDDLSPAEVGTIIDERAHRKDVSAEIINLAVKGHIKITYIEKSGILKADDYELEKLAIREDVLNELQFALLKALFADKKKIRLSDLKDKFYEDLNDIIDRIYQATVNKGYFPKNPKKIRRFYISLAILVLVVGWFVGPFLGWIGVVSVWITGILILILGNVMPKKTKKGVLAREKILGLKMYLEVAEKDRINFHNAPKKNPKIFEKLLPFAIVLGVEKKWAKQFEDIYHEAPNWYSSASARNFSALALANNLNSFQSQANSTLASMPSSASSGGSGFSGGGSGGGFGGGGGGSW